MKLICPNCKDHKKFTATAHYSHKKIKKLLKDVREVERAYSSDIRRTPSYLKSLYSDSSILSLWDNERYNKKTGEGWLTFEGFLLDTIENNVISDAI